MTCDGVKGCSGAFVSNGKKVAGMIIEKYGEDHKISSFSNYTIVLPSEKIKFLI